MKNYLSFGGGVNSVALYLLLIEQNVEFEPIFVNHGADWPETYKYIVKFQQWTMQKGWPPMTILRPNVGTLEKKRFSSLFDYCFFKRLTPSRRYRSCTDKFKISPIREYCETPCFQLIAIDAGETHRARIAIEKGVENRYPLIENEINRDGCKQIIKRHGLPIPMKSGCYFCPYQRRTQLQLLRRKHPQLFCQVEILENRAFERTKDPVVFLKGIPIRKFINEEQIPLFAQDEYPPCQCGL